MKKVLILYGSYGGGHLSAAKAVDKYLSTYCKVDTKIYDCIEYINRPLNKLTTGAYTWMAKKAPGLWGRIYANSQKGIFSHICIRANKMMAGKLNKLILEENPDLIVSTHPFSSQMVNFLKEKGKNNCKLVTVMTDFAPHDQWLIGNKYTDAFFVANDSMKNYLAYLKVYLTNLEKMGHKEALSLTKSLFEKYPNVKVKYVEPALPLNWADIYEQIQFLKSKDADVQL